jgi:hypothetical protein
LNKLLAALYASGRLTCYLVWKLRSAGGGGSVVELGFEDPKRKLNTTLEILFWGEIGAYLKLVSKQLVTPERARSSTQAHDRKRPHSAPPPCR